MLAASKEPRKRQSTVTAASHTNHPDYTRVTTESTSRATSTQNVKPSTRRKLVKLLLDLLRQSRNTLMPNQVILSINHRQLHHEPLGEEVHRSMANLPKMLRIRPLPDLHRHVQVINPLINLLLRDLSPLTLDNNNSLRFNSRKTLIRRLARKRHRHRRGHYHSSSRSHRPTNNRAQTLYDPGHTNPLRNSDIARPSPSYLRFTSCPTY